MLRLTEPPVYQAPPQYPGHGSKLQNSCGEGC